MFRPLLPLVAVVAASVLLGCGAGTVGHGCTTDANCDNGQTCLIQFAGGFCGKSCPQEGTSKDCPGDSICANQAGVLLCSATCDNPSECRSGYQCSAVDGTRHQVCTQ